MKQIDHEVIEIDPGMAAQLLTTNTANRPLNQARVRNLAHAIERGEWELNGDAIRMSESGVLLDGQHRLAAIVEADTAVQSLIVTGLPDTVFDVIDRGTTRTIGDILHIRGEENWNHVGAAARLYYKWANLGNPFRGGSEYNPTARQIEETLDQHPGIRKQVARAVASSWIRRYIKPRIAGFAFYVFSQSDYADHLDSFIAILDTGVCDERDAALVLRDMLMEDRAVTTKRKMSEKYRAALIFKAFKKHALGEHPKFLRVRTSGKSPEKALFEIPMDGGGNRDVA